MMSQQTQKQQVWSTKWDQYNLTEEEVIHTLYVDYSCIVKIEYEDRYATEYLKSIHLLKEYSGGNASYIFTQTIAFFNRIGSGHWNTTHGAEVAGVLNSHTNATFRPSPQTLFGLLNNVKNAVGNVGLNPKGDLYAILSVIEEKCGLKILEGNQIVFDPNNPQGETVSSAATMSHR